MALVATAAAAGSKAFCIKSLSSSLEYDSCGIPSAVLLHTWRTISLACGVHPPPDFVAFPGRVPLPMASAAPDRMR